MKFLLIVLTASGPVQLGPFPSEQQCEWVRAWVLQVANGPAQSARCWASESPQSPAMKGK